MSHDEAAPAAPAPVRGRSRGTAAQAAAAQGTAAPETAEGPASEALEARLAALESRVAQLAELLADLAARPAAGDEQLVEAVLRRFLPDEAVDHMKTARREDLLAIRAILDAVLARLDRTPQAREPVRRRESISLD